ncbi:RrF2 family transcriptional regulator [Neofamilia massiliensis]|uniref:RrF2 family transcriptional regulator n=1 Tax=Neofamilia massiliensis TaxID=1673724 RepID=UPI0006BB97FC|nr:Rrf2 family transcriptional regulator [Neofamilia massiliensis]
MKLNLENDYGFRIIYAFCKNPKGEILTALQLSQELLIPERFTYRILRKLMAADLIESIRGPKGGYVLCKDPKDISLYDVYTAISGDLVINACVNEGLCDAGSKMGHCAVHNSLTGIQNTLLDEFKSVIFSDLVKEEKNI